MLRVVFVPPLMQSRDYAALDRAQRMSERNCIAERTTAWKADTTLPVPAPR